MSHPLGTILIRGVETGAVPGAVVTIVDRDGVCWEGAAGETIAGSGSAMTTDTVGAIFSMTKAVTGVAAMQLVEQGRMSLDAPASEVIPWFGETQVLEGFDVDGDPITRPSASPITLRNLLTHTSGFTYELFNADNIAWREKRPHRVCSPLKSKLSKARLRSTQARDGNTALVSTVRGRWSKRFPVRHWESTLPPISQALWPCMTQPLSATNLCLAEPLRSTLAAPMDL